MKKLNTLIAAICIVSTSLAQDTIWSDDFSTPANWTTTKGSGTIGNWAIGTAAPTGSKSGQMGTITSTSGGNFALFDSDASGGSSNQDAYLTTTTSIDLSTYDGAILEFESYFQRYIFGYPFVEVSTDGSTWTPMPTLGIYPDVAKGGTLPLDAKSDNPAKISVNISTIAKNQATVWIRFRYKATEFNLSGDYAWMIDDVVLLSPPAHSLTMDKTNYNGIWKSNGIQASYIPLKQVANNPLFFEGVVVNGGTKSQTNTQLHVDVSDGSSSVFSDSSSAKTVANLTQDTLYVSTPYTPTVSGLYTVSFWAKSDSIVSTDTVTSTFVITDTIYGKDNNKQTNVVMASCSYEVGNILEAYTKQTATSISIYVASNSQEGAEVYGILYDASSSPIELARTDIYTLPAGSDTAGRWVTLPLLAPIDLTVGNLYLVGGGWNSNGSNAFIGVAGSTLSSSEAYINDVGGCTQNCTPFCQYPSIPMVRLIVDGYIPSSISDLKNSISTSIYPNPTEGEFTIAFTNVIKDNYTLEIKNVLGQVICTDYKTIAGNYIQNINISDFNKGVYFLTVRNSETETTQKIVLGLK